MNLGYISALFFALTTVNSALFVEHALPNFGQFNTVLLISMCIAGCFFNLIGFRHIKITYKEIMHNTLFYLGFSTLIGLIWIATIYGVNYSNGFLFNLMFFLSLACIAYLQSYFLSRSWFYFTIGILSLAIIMLVAILHKALILGILIGIFGGCCSYAYRKISSSYSKKSNSSAVQILMIRFWPVVLGLLLFSKPSAIMYSIEYHFLGIALFSFLTLIIPTYLNQYAINTIGAEKSAIIAALIFPLTWLGEILVSPHINISIIDFIIAIIVSIITVLPAIYGQIKRAKISKS